MRKENSSSGRFLNKLPIVQHISDSIISSMIELVPLDFVWIAQNPSSPVEYLLPLS